MKYNVNQKSGFALVIVAPSATGKSTVINRIVNEVYYCEYSISVTTRQIREGEKDGVDYTFVSVMQFEELIAMNMFAEWANVYGNYYGTLKHELHEQMNDNKVILMDLDNVGLLQLLSNDYDNVVSVFLLPDDTNKLEQRLLQRNTSNKDIKTRLENIETEIEQSEYCDYIVSCKSLNKCVNEIKDIIKAELKTVNRNEVIANEN